MTTAFRKEYVFDLKGVTKVEKMNSEVLHVVDQAKRQLFAPKTAIWMLERRGADLRIGIAGWFINSEDVDYEAVFADALTEIREGSAPTIFPFDDFEA